MTTRAKRSFARTTALSILLALPGSAMTRPAGIPTYDIWAVQLGQPLTQIPFRKIAFAACGTNGGPPSRVLDRLESYTACRPEESGLREVDFQYDDEDTYIDLAHHVDIESLTASTSMYGHPIIPSVLVDEDGIVRGIRVVTDDRTSDYLRTMAVRLATNLQGRYSAWPLTCTDLPPADGQTPVGTWFIHSVCTGDNAALGQRLLITGHYFRRAGQVAVDPHSRQPIPGAYESATRFELVEAPRTPFTPANDRIVTP